MPIVNFNLTKPLEKKINKTIKEQGFSSKAEFFRFAALFYLQNIDYKNDISDEEFEKAVGEISKKIEKKLKNKKIPTLKEQLKDL